MSYYKVSYDKLFPYAPFLNLRIGVEMLVETGQNPTDCLRDCKEIVDDFYKQENPLPDESMTGTITRTIENISPIDSIKKEIGSCKELKVLESYRLIVKNNPALQESYDNKLNSFNNG